MTSIYDDRRVAAGEGPEITAPTASHPQLHEAIKRHAKETKINMGRLLLHGCNDGLHKDWMKPLYDLWLAVTRLATSSVHFKVCTTKRYH